MLAKVTWTEFWVVLVILLVLYYLFVGAKFYAKEIKGLLKNGFPKKVAAESKAVAKEPQVNIGDFDLLDELEAVVNDLRYAILEKVGKPASKPELLKQLQARLESYHGLRKPAFRVAITNYIMTHAAELCGVVFTEQELNSAWEALLD